MGSVFIGIDVGTLDVHGILISMTGKLVAHQHRAIAVRSPFPGYAEHEPEQDWWNNLCSITQQLLHTSGIEPQAVAGIGLAGLFPVTCALDEQGSPVGPAILYSDSRAEQEVDEVSRICGQPLTGDEVIPNLLWLARHRPLTFARVKTVLSATGYLVYRLTGQATLDPHNACRFGGVVNSTRTGWELEKVAALGLPPDILPQIAATTKVIGTVTRQAASFTGLVEGTPVITGTTDTLATLVGNGVLELGEAMIYYGSTGTLSIVTVPLEDAFHQPALFAPDAPYQLAVYLIGSGAMLQWALDLITACAQAPENRDTLFRRLDMAAADVEPGAGGIFVLPYLAGRYYPQPDGAVRGQIIGLSLHHQAAHIWRALLEAPGYVLATRLQESLPHPIRRLVASGGGARSETWRRIISDMTGLAQHYLPSGSGAMGAAALAALGTGHVSDLKAIREMWLQDERVTEPDPAQVAMYRELLPRWQALDEAASARRSY